MTKKHIVEYAFHMPITAKERNRYRTIASLVARDEYLPEGYRKPKDDKQRIIEDRNKYKY